MPPEKTLEEVLERAKSHKNGLETPGFMNMIASFEGYLNIYKDIRLAWTSKL